MFSSPKQWRQATKDHITSKMYVTQTQKGDSPPSLCAIHHRPCDEIAGIACPNRNLVSGLERENPSQLKIDHWNPLDISAPSHAVKHSTRQRRGEPTNTRLIPAPSWPGFLVTSPVPGETCFAKTASNRLGRGCLKDS